jgi:hypothetical protein
MFQILTQEGWVEVMDGILEKTDHEIMPVDVRAK